MTTTTDPNTPGLWGPGNGCDPGLWNVHGECLTEEPCIDGTGVISFLPCVPVTEVPPMLPRTGAAETASTAMVGGSVLLLGVALLRFARR